MNELPLVSICMITYAHDKFIEEAINSVLMQECDFEIQLVLSNDNSPDNTDAIIQRILNEHPRASRIKYIKQENNLGMIANFLTALAECNGKYIALCDGDDYWTDKYKLYKQIDFLEKNDECSFCFHKSIRFDKRNETHNKIYPIGLKKTILNTKDFFKIPTIPTASVIYRNIIEMPKLKHNHPDMMLYSSLLSKGKAGFIDEIMSAYRLHDNGVSNKYSEPWYLERRIAELAIEKKHPDFSSDVKSQIAKMHVKHVVVYLNKSRGKLSADQKKKYLNSICFSRYFYGLPLKDYFTLFKTILK